MLYAEPNYHEALETIQEARRRYFLDSAVQRSPRFWRRRILLGLAKGHYVPSTYFWRGRFEPAFFRALNQLIEEGYVKVSRHTNRRYWRNHPELTRAGLDALWHEDDGRRRPPAKTQRKKERRGRLGHHH